MEVKRIAVTGPAGAGKSRLARDLGAAYGIEVLHLDTLFWKPGWVQTPAAEFEALQRRELERDSWIVDAQYDDMIPDWLDAADAVVFVDASPLRCLWRVSRRRLDRGRRARHSGRVRAGAGPSRAGEVRPTAMELPKDGAAEPPRGSRPSPQPSSESSCLGQEGKGGSSWLTFRTAGNLSDVGSTVAQDGSDARDDLERRELRSVAPRLGPPRPGDATAEPHAAPRLAA